MRVLVLILGLGLQTAGLAAGVWGLVELLTHQPGPLGHAVVWVGSGLVTFAIGAGVADVVS
jgi:hypothetical protein